MLKNFRSQLLDTVLDFLWAQWSALGVPGHTRSEKTRIVDPEALILLTCSLGRHDARLLDEMLEWVNMHERLVQIQRLNNMARDEEFTGLPVLRAVGAWMSHNKAGVKWRRLMKPGAAPTGAEALFRGRGGKPLPVVREPDPVFERHGFLRDKVFLRRHAQTFDPELPSNLQIRLRAFFGVNSRAEVMTYLLTHERAGAAEIAQATYYYKRTVYNALSEMRLSGLLQLVSTLPFVHARFGSSEGMLGPLWVPVAGHVASVLIGLLLILLADQLRRRKRLAWQVAVTLFALGLVLHLLKGPHPVAAVIAGGLLVALVVLRAQFRAQRLRYPALGRVFLEQLGKPVRCVGQCCLGIDLPLILAAVGVNGGRGDDVAPIAPEIDPRRSTGEVSHLAARMAIDDVQPVPGAAGGRDRHTAVALGLRHALRAVQVLDDDAADGPGHDADVGGRFRSPPIGNFVLLW